MRTLKFILFISLLAAASCNFAKDESVTKTSNTPKPAPTATPRDEGKDPAGAGGKAAPEKAAVQSDECFSVDTGDNVVYKKQTFAIDFVPFEGSCFVTEHNPEYDDPPLESQFGIYKDGKRVYEFPSQFNGTTFGCWVEAVSFQDLNADSRTDVIVVGKCSAKANPYNENMVYVNDGKGFTTNEDANTKLSEFATVKDIAGYVKENREMFFK
jgi:hypothetical protein